MEYTAATASEISPGVIRRTNNANITLAMLWLRVKSDEITDGLRDIAGNYLDGNWTNPTAYNDNTGNSAFGGVGSGNGTNGGTFDFKVNVSYHQGDTDGDLDIDITDLNNVQNNFGGTGLGDTDGDNDVDISDLNNVRNNFGFNPNNWPALGGGSMLMMGGGGGQQLAIGEQRLRQALRDYYYSRLTGEETKDSFDDLLFWELLGDEEWWKVTLSA